MARERQVTRTIKTVEVVALCINLETTEVFNEKFTLTDYFKNDNKLMNEIEKQLKERYPQVKNKVVDIVDKVGKETLYGMKETEFIKLAKVLDSETRKEIEAEN